MVGPELPGPARASRAPVVGPLAAVAAAVAIVVLAAAMAFATRSGTRPAAAAVGVPSPGASSGSAAVPGADGSPARGGAARLTGAAPAVGSIAAVGSDGVITVIARDGRSIVLTQPGEVSVGFPAWSPDGSRIAAIAGRDGGTTVEVIPVDPARGAAGGPHPIYTSALRGAFYVAWLPGGQAVSFLTNDADLVDLQVADAGRSTPIDDDDRSSVVRKGAPLYFDWLDDDRALLHVGVGPEAFLAVVGRDGHEIGGDLTRPGDFRSAGVSADGRFVAYARATTGSGAEEAGEVLVAPIGGGPELTLPTFGPTALTFAPGDGRLMTIGADQAGLPNLAFPVGPLRLIDSATGDHRTLLAGAVVAAFWSPDGRTIFALRLQPAGGSSAAAGSPSPVPTEVHALFVDVASGTIPVDHVVRPGPRLVSEILPYFDQYALSHRLWAPDSSSFLLPVVGDDGTGTVIALPRDGSPSPFSIGATAAFWSP